MGSPVYLPIREGGSAIPKVEKHNTPKVEEHHSCPEGAMFTQIEDARACAKSLDALGQGKYYVLPTGSGSYEVVSKNKK